MKIPFVKAHGALNDFLLTWEGDAPGSDRPRWAREICHRNSGAGADGWLLVDKAEPGAGYDGRIRLYNSDGSDSEISGNGTRCAAAFLADSGVASNPVRILTGAGIKEIQVLGRSGKAFDMEMNMGLPRIALGDLSRKLLTSSGPVDVTLLDVGNPQCAVPADFLGVDWKTTWRPLAVELEGHSHFPKRSNVSFFRALSRHDLEVLFYERGAGETMSSGTGSTGAVAAARARGLVDSPVTVHTAAGTLQIRFDEAGYFLHGPAVIVAAGEFYS